MSTKELIEDAEAAWFYVKGESIYAQTSLTILNEKLAKLVELQRQRERQAVPSATITSDSDEFLRLSKSGYTLRVGWGDKMRIVAASPKPLHELPSDQQKQWIEDAFKLCDAWNAMPIAAAPSPEMREAVPSGVNFGAIVDALEAISNDIRPEVEHLAKLIYAYADQITAAPSPELISPHPIVEELTKE